MIASKLEVLVVGRVSRDMHSCHVMWITWFCEVVFFSVCDVRGMMVGLVSLLRFIGLFLVGWWVGICLRYVIWRVLLLR